MKRRCDRERLVRTVVELEDDGVGFTAINTRVLKQVVEHPALVPLVDATYPLTDARPAVIEVLRVESLRSLDVAGLAPALQPVASATLQMELARRLLHPTQPTDLAQIREQLLLNEHTPRHDDLRRRRTARSAVSARLEAVLTAYGQGVTALTGGG
jgi:hypothetical protein